MLTLRLCAAALTWGDFHIGNFLPSNIVSLNKAASLSVHHFNMPEQGLSKARVIFSMAYPSSLKAIREKDDILLIIIFQGTSL